ncbi:hypothetical protein ACLB2K_076671 [Fragaria x ananassa]
MVSYGAALARPLPYVLSALCAEVEILRAGLLVAIHQGWEEIAVETDCVVLVHALTGVGDDLSESGRMMEDCRRYASSFTSFNIRHIFGEANGVVHRLAHLVSWSNLDEFWVGETPIII